MNKIHTPVDSPMRLDMGKYTEENKKCTYQLYSIINHGGEKSSGGHYTATCQEPTDTNTWHHFNDDNTSLKMEAKFVTTKYSYILFYKKDSDDDADCSENMNNFGNSSEKETKEVNFDEEEKDIPIKR